MRPLRIFGYYALPLALLAILFALFVGLGARLRGGVNALGTGQTTLPTGIMVEPGAILGGQALRIGEAISPGTSPATTPAGGLQRPVGSYVYTRDGAAAYIKTGTAATDWTVAGGTGASGSNNSQSKAIDRAGLLSGIPAALLTCYREDWGPTAPTQYVDALVGSGGIAPQNSPTADVGGYLGMTTNFTVSSRARRHVAAMLFPRADTGRFYMATRASLPTLADAQAIMIVGSFDSAGTNVLGIGACGTTSTTNFVVNYDALGGSCAGTKATTTTTIDVNFHLFEMWTVADGKIHFAIDLTEVAGSPFTMASPPTVSERPVFDVQNGTTATPRTLLLDWYLACWPQT